MKEDISNPNIEWKKNNSEPSERLSLRINSKEAAAYSAAKKNVFKTFHLLKIPYPCDNIILS